MPSSHIIYSLERMHHMHFHIFKLRSGNIVALVELPKRRHQPTQATSVTLIYLFMCDVFYCHKVFEKDSARFDMSGHHDCLRMI